MIISIKHDTLNGAVGAAAGISEAERRIIDGFREEVCRDPGFIPRNPGDDYPFASFFAAYLLSAEEPAAALTWVYGTIEVLRRSVHFTTLKVPLDQINVFALARAIVNGRLKGTINEAIQSKNFTIEVPRFPDEHPVPVGPEARFGLALRELHWLPETKLLAGSPETFVPFITFRPPGAGQEDAQRTAAHGKSREAPVVFRQSAEPLLVPATRKEPMRAPAEKQLPSRGGSRLRLPATLVAIIVSTGLGMILGKVLAERQVSRPPTTPEGEEEQASTETEDVWTMLSGTSSSRNFILRREGEPLWIYGGEIDSAGTRDDNAPHPDSEELVIDRKPVKAEGGQPVRVFREIFYAYDEPDKGRQRKEADQPFIVLTEKEGQGAPKSGVPGNRPLWQQVQLLSFIRVGGDTIDLVDGFTDNALSWPTEFHESGMSWIEGGQYTVVLPAETCQIHTPGLGLGDGLKSFSVTARSIWLSGRSDRDFGLALVDTKSPRRHHILFSVTADGQVRVSERQGDTDLPLARTELRNGVARREVPLEIEITPGGVLYRVDEREVFSKPMETDGMRKVGLFTCGPQAIGFRGFSIRDSGAGEITNGS